MSQLQITAKTASNTIQIKIENDSNSDIQYNFKLEIQIFQQILENGNQRYKLAYKNVFYSLQRSIVVKDLLYGAMYRVQVGYSWGRGGEKRVRNVFVYTEAFREEAEDQDQPQQYNNAPTPQPRIRPRPSSAQPAKKPAANRNNELSNSELLIKTLAQSSQIVNKEKAHKYMLQSRKCRNVKQFINQKHGRRVNPAEVGDKRMIVIQSKILFSEIYQYRDGCKFFRNDWGMGPFYSYDRNEDQIRKK